MSKSAESPVKTDIPSRERLIFALDVPDLDQARQLVDTLGDSVVFYKLGWSFSFPAITSNWLRNCRAAERRFSPI